MRTKKREADKKGIKGYKNAKKTFGNGFVPRNYEDIMVVALVFSPFFC